MGERSANIKNQHYCSSNYLHELPKLNPLEAFSISTSSIFGMTVRNAHVIETKTKAGLKKSKIVDSRLGVASDRLASDEPDINHVKFRAFKRFEMLLEKSFTPIMNQAVGRPPN